VRDRSQDALQKGAVASVVVPKMTTTTAAPKSIMGATTGVCIPPDFPEVAIRSALDQAGHAVAFWHADHEAAIEACREESPELLLLGSCRIDATGLECIRALVEAGRSTKLVLICERSGQGEVRKALDAGVRGLVALNDVEVALPSVIEVVRAGQISVPSSRGKELPKRILTAREKQILGLVVMGMTNAEIATKLFLAESTIKSHLSSAFAKLGVSSRSEAATVILDPRSGAGLGILTIPTG
jgi:two-component system, NarL family, response regulator DesR